ncbi:cupin domain-containing protein [Amycolatopsis acidicola]|uniref:Cupin domain-containing protein n=1 Tax=Amycolatopsis acidicola TaxID=2596893 RepID=A0A5N0UWT3_9PSEU|nr:cupin domain-containing protein [Amycolatopsis acidicola]KAA9156744.1 cupin domain-containing protein [Amycolatopsis acidicola]
MRKVITAEKPDGRSYVQSDDVVGTTSFGSMDLEHLWRADSPPTVPAGGEAPPAMSFPPPGGVWVLTWTVPPGATGERPENDEAENGEAENGEAENGERPGFHVTDSVDVNLVLSGSVVLELDDGEVALTAGDLVVVNGTRHAWRNDSAEAVRVLSTIIGAARADSAG